MNELNTEHIAREVGADESIVADVVARLQATQDELQLKMKGEIDAKIRKNGVEKFTLDIVDKDAQSDGKVVGTCGGGAKKIVYKRG